MSTVPPDLATMLDTRREAPTGMFLEDLIDAMEAVPLRVRRNQRILRGLDQIATKKSTQGQTLQKAIFTKLRARTRRPATGGAGASSAAASSSAGAGADAEQQHALQLQALQCEALFQEALAHSDEKCAIAAQSVALLDGHIAHLNADLATLEADLRAKGSFDSTELAPGDEVAARVNGRENLWILCVVARYVVSTDQYEVCDLENRTQRYLLPLEQVVQIPKTDSAANCANRSISKGNRVIALYPDTTSFYLASVTTVPRRAGPPGPANSFVMVQFDDDHDETGKIPERGVPAKYVLEPNADDFF